jgi:hypothetical protein
MKARLALLLFTSALACVRHATPEECSALLDRYVELLVRERDPTVSEIDLSSKKEQAREKAAHDEAFAACPKEVGGRAMRCAMAAPNVDEFEKCLE